MKAIFPQLLVWLCLSLTVPVAAFASVTEEVKQVVDQVVRVVGTRSCKSRRRSRSAARL